MNKTTKIAIISGLSLATLTVLQAPSFAVQFTLSNGTSPNSLTFTDSHTLLPANNFLLGQRFTPNRSTPTGNPDADINPIPLGTGNTILLKQFSFLGVSEVVNLTNFNNLYVYELSPTASNIGLGQDPSNITATGWTKIATATGGLNGTTATWNFAGNGVTLNTSGTQYAAIAGSNFAGLARINSYTPSVGNISPFNTPSTSIRSFFSPATPNQAQILSSAVNPKFSALFDTNLGSGEIPENFSTLPGLLALGAFFGVSKLARKKSA